MTIPPPTCRGRYCIVHSFCFINFNTRSSEWNGRKHFINGSVYFTPARLDLSLTHDEPTIRRTLRVELKRERIWDAWHVVCVVPRRAAALIEDVRRCAHREISSVHTLQSKSSCLRHSHL